MYIFVTVLMPIFNSISFFFLSTLLTAEVQYHNHLRWFNAKLIHLIAVCLSGYVLPNQHPQYCGLLFALLISKVQHPNHSPWNNAKLIHQLADSLFQSASKASKKIVPAPTVIFFYKIGSALT